MILIEWCSGDGKNPVILMGSVGRKQTKTEEEWLKKIWNYLVYFVWTTKRNQNSTEDKIEIWILSK